MTVRVWVSGVAAELRGCASTMTQNVSNHFFTTQSR